MSEPCYTNTDDTVSYPLGCWDRKEGGNVLFLISRSPLQHWGFVQIAPVSLQQTGQKQGLTQPLILSQVTSAVCSGGESVYDTISQPLLLLKVLNESTSPVSAAVSLLSLFSWSCTFKCSSWLTIFSSSTDSRGFRGFSSSPSWLLSAAEEEAAAAAGTGTLWSSGANSVNSAVNEESEGQRQTSGSSTPHTEGLKKTWFIQSTWLRCDVSLGWVMHWAVCRRWGHSSTGEQISCYIPLRRELRRELRLHWSCCDINGCVLEVENKRRHMLL